MRYVRVALVCLLALALCLSVAACGQKAAEKPTATTEAPAEKTAEPVAVSGEPIKVALGGIITPKSALSYYNELLDYISKKVGRPIELNDETDYGKINEMMKNKEVDLGFVCAGPYTDAHAAWGMELLAAPQVKGQSVYFSNFIVPIDSTAKSLDDLKGKTFAFTDPKSNTGKLVPTYVLARKGFTPEQFFGKTFFSKGHDKSIEAVAKKEADGAAVDSLIYEYMAATDPTFTSKTKVIFKSDPYGIPPVTVHPDMDPALKEKLQAAFTGMADDPEGAAILKKMNIEKFVKIEDSAYNSVREMSQWIKDNPLK